MNLRYACGLAELPDPGAREIQLSGAAGSGIVLVRSGNLIRAYLNRCPHTGSPLNWMPDRFLDEDGKRIVCATHAALFRIEDGSCLAGPCAGQGLTSFPVVICGSDVYVRYDA